MRRIWSYFSIVILLTIAVYCEFQVNYSLFNACLDVAVTFVVFFLGYNDTQKKSKSQQGQIQELQNRIKQLEEDRTNPQPSVDWKHAIKR